MQQTRYIPFRFAMERVSKEQHPKKRNKHEPQVQLHEAEGKMNRGEGGGHGEERLVHDDHAEKRQRVGRDEAVVGPLDRT